MPRTNKDNASNKSLGRAGKSKGSTVASRGSSRGGGGGGSSSGGACGGSGNSSSSASSSSYDHTSYTSSVERVVKYVDRMVISNVCSSAGTDGGSYDNRSSGSSSSPATSSVKTYKDNPYNRRTGRVDQPVGSVVIHKKKVYKDNPTNRRIGRAGKPLGSMKVSKVSPTTKRIRDIENGGDSLLGDRRDDFAMELAMARLERDQQEQAWRQQTGREKVRTTVELFDNYKGTEINFEDLKLSKKIGAGGFGDVHFAEWEGGVVAVKKLRVQRVSKRRLEEFTKEVLEFCDLQHPNIVGIIGACVTTPNLCIVMEYMQTSLYEALHIQNDTEFTEVERLKIIRGSCRGLKYLHKRNIAHCDLKSQNVLLDYTAGETCVAKITDFGLSMIKANSESSTSVEQVSNVGTPRHSAPEVLRGESTDMRQADVYSLGLIIFEVVFEEEPFYDLGYAQLKNQVGKNGLLPDMSEGQEVASSVRDTVNACLNFHPKHRPDVARLKKTFGDMKSLYK